MKLKSTLLAVIMFFFVASQTKGASFMPAAVKPVAETTNDLTEEQKARLEAIKKRVDEIMAMNKSTLTNDERKALKSELKDMKKEAKALRGGVYLSVGAIIIIILLLILLL